MDDRELIGAHPADPEPGRGWSDPGSTVVHRVAVVADDTLVAFELVSVVHVLQSADVASGAVRYEVGVVGPARAVSTVSSACVDADGPSDPSFAVVPQHPLEWAAEADTVIVPGHASFLEVVPEEIAALVKDAWTRGARLVSLGLGTFALAAVGVLDGRAAVTHWRWADQLAARYPRVAVQRDRLFVSDVREECDGAGTPGRPQGCASAVHTAAGAAAVVDVVLHLVEQDHGAAVAAAIANQVVAPPRRAGEQAQYLEHRTPIEGDLLTETMRWAEQRLTAELSVADLARHAHMSTRHFGRRFRAATGATPLDWLLRARIRRAQELLEATGWSVERVGHESGFGSPGTFRHHFVRVVGTTPGRYRRTYSGGSPVGRCG